MGALVAAGSLSRQRGVQGAFLGVAAGISVALPSRLLYEAQAAAVQEQRELWGLAGVMSDGKPWPAPGGWALGADALAFVIREARARKSQTVVELGPGTSSVVLGRAGLGLELYGLEHNDIFVTVVRENLAAHGLDDYRLIHAPLTATTVEGRTVQWYEPSALEGLPDEIDVLIVDGPPNWDGAGNRSPAWPLLNSRMRSGALVVVDDTQRPDERSMAEGWISSGAMKLVFDGGSFIAMEVS